jgi:hypothetical protein
MRVASPASTKSFACSRGQTPKEHRRSAHFFYVLALAAVIICIRAQPTCAQADMLDSVIEGLKERAKPPAALTAPNGSQSRQSGPRYIFHATITPEPLLVLRLQDLFVAYFEETVDLTSLLHRIILESAVAAVPGFGEILYNPGHMLFLHLPEDWRQGGKIRVAVLVDVREMLNRERPANLVLAAYTQGFEEFALLSKLMNDKDARDAHADIWSSASPSDHEKERMRYLLLRPMEQAAAVAKEPPSCREPINRFVDEVRNDKRATIPAVPGLTRIVKPVRLARHDNDIFLVLGETLMARYYIFARFRAGEEGCPLAWEASSFAM